MPNTTNFNWTTPADTDLVKDGALAIRTLANGIDTSLVDLKGGTTGQVLSKATNTDMDFTWVAQDDSNAIQNAIIDAKGDLIVGTAADTPARLAVSATNGDILTVDSSTASGLKWATPSAGGFVGCSATFPADVTLSNNTGTTLNFSVEQFDTDSFHSTTTNTSRFTIPSGKAGYYRFTFVGTFEASSAGHRTLNIYKNGSAITTARSSGGDSSNVFALTNDYVVNLAVADYIEFIVTQSSGGNLALRGTDNFFPATIVQMQYLGA